jgi:methionyl aminopeptidase
MIYIKSAEEIELLKISNRLVTQTLAELAKIIRPGVSTLELDTVAEAYIRDHHGIPGFLGYNGFPNTLCTSVNSEVVHGIPSAYKLKEGDIVSIDCGVLLNGYFGDSAYTFALGQPDDRVMNLMKTTKEALFIGIQQAKEGNRLGDIGHAVQQHAENHGFSVVREMVGHGIGKNLHEEPEVPNYGKRGSGLKLKSGMVLCIEPMINMGKKFIRQQKDGWTIITQDNLPSAHYELALAVKGNEPVVLTSFGPIEETLASRHE